MHDDVLSRGAFRPAFGSERGSERPNTERRFPNAEQCKEPTLFGEPRMCSNMVPKRGSKIQTLGRNGASLMPPLGCSRNTDLTRFANSLRNADGGCWVTLWKIKNKIEMLPCELAIRRSVWT